MGTLSGPNQSAPGEDAEPDPNILAFVTENGAPGGSAGAADVDGGPTDLISPVFDLDGSDGTVSYYRWMFSSEQDTLEIAITGDGSNWTLVEERKQLLVYAMPEVAEVAEVEDPRSPR